MRLLLRSMEWMSPVQQETSEVDLGPKGTETYPRRANYQGALLELDIVASKLH